MPSFAVMSDSLTDPTGTNSLVVAVAWVQGALLGTAATTIATIVFATVGIMMLSGRVNWRKSVTVILGCFILFGAATIAIGIRSAAGGTSGEVYDKPPVVADDVPPAAPTPQVPSKPSNYDPYAGAAPRY